MTAGATPLPRIAIVGGGIGGLATAAFLGRAGLPSTVYEQAARLSEVGAGLVVAPNAARLLRRLGVHGDLRERAVQLDTGWEFRRWADGTVLSSENLSVACERLYGEHTYTTHRADLLRVIESRVPRQSIELGRKCPGHHLVHYPVSAGERVNLVAFAPAGDCTVESWTATASVEEFLAEFGGWEQRKRDAAFAEEDPLVANGWIYEYDPDAALDDDAVRH